MNASGIGCGITVASFGPRSGISVGGSVAAIALSATAGGGAGSSPDGSITVAALDGLASAAGSAGGAGAAGAIPLAPVPIIVFAIGLSSASVIGLSSGVWLEHQQRGVGGEPHAAIGVVARERGDVLGERLAARRGEPRARRDREPAVGGVLAVEPIRHPRERGGVAERGERGAASPRRAKSLSATTRSRYARALSSPWPARNVAAATARAASGWASSPASASFALASPSTTSAPAARRHWSRPGGIASRMSSSTGRASLPSPASASATAAVSRIPGSLAARFRIAIASLSPSPDSTAASSTLSLSPEPSSAARTFGAASGSFMPPSARAALTRQPARRRALRRAATRRPAWRRDDRVDGLALELEVARRDRVVEARARALAHGALSPAASLSAMDAAGAAGTAGAGGAAGAAAATTGGAGLASLLSPPRIAYAPTPSATTTAAAPATTGSLPRRAGVACGPALAP